MKNDLLKKAHDLLRKAVPGTRRAFEQEHGILAQTYKAAMQLWDRQKAEGVSKEDRLVGLEKTLRAAWPRGGVFVPKCTRCDDTGLVMSVCRKGQRCDGVSTRIDSPRDQPGKYPRLCATHPESDYEHDYGTPCWCEKGARFRSPAKPSAEDFTQSGRSKPMTKLGRF